MYELYIIRTCPSTTWSRRRSPLRRSWPNKSPCSFSAYITFDVVCPISGHLFKFYALSFIVLSRFLSKDLWESRPGPEWRPLSYQAFRRPSLARRSFAKLSWHFAGLPNAASNSSPKDDRTQERHREWECGYVACFKTCCATSKKQFSDQALKQCVATGCNQGEVERKAWTSLGTRRLRPQRLIQMSHWWTSALPLHTRYPRPTTRKECLSMRRMLLDWIHMIHNAYNLKL